MSPASFGLVDVPEGWDWNHPAFYSAAAQCESAGYKVINPAQLDADAGDVGTEEWHVYLRRDIKALADCDTIVMLPGWESSKGARLERHIASELGMEIVLPHEYVEWLAHREVFA